MVFYAAPTGLPIHTWHSQPSPVGLSWADLFRPLGARGKAKTATCDSLLTSGNSGKAFEVTASDFEEISGGEAEGAEEAFSVAGKVEG